MILVWLKRVIGFLVICLLAHLVGHEKPYGIGRSTISFPGFWTTGRTTGQERGLVVF